MIKNERKHQVMKDDAIEIEDVQRKKTKCCKSCKNWMFVDPQNVKMEKKLGMKINNIALYN